MNFFNNKSKERKKIQNKKGISLVETLIVVMVFSIIGVLTTNAVFLTLRGTQKSQSTLKIREKINYVISIIQRQLRGAKEISECPNSDPYIIEYVDEYENLSSFSCKNMTGIGYIASGSARIVSNDIDITSCSFSCEESSSAGPPSVTINISAEDNSISGVTKGKATFTTKVVLRNY